MAHDQPALHFYECIALRLCAFISIRDCLINRSFVACAYTKEVHDTIGLDFLLLEQLPILLQIIVEQDRLYMCAEVLITHNFNLE
jgi:hypothetical protein